MRSLLVAGVVLVGLTAACGTGDPPARREAASPGSPAVSPASPAAASAPVRCDEGIGGAAAPPAEFQVVGDGVALPTSDVRKAALQAAEAKMPDGSPGSFAKQGLLVRRGHLVELSVPERLTGRAWLVWGKPGSPGARVVADRCQGSEEWIVFPGGYLVRDVGCLPIRVRVDGGTVKEVLIGVGAPCPGQGPAPQI
ncbi:hypothetical protein [Microtetraspora malaysiensis]|uniref:hypothetical protein n=1 Tax=Microtetraspora malaysiensis TaxID=161358 RepID=UPI003D8A9C08